MCDLNGGSRVTREANTVNTQGRSGSMGRTRLTPDPAPQELTRRERPGGAGGPAGTRGQQLFVSAPPRRAEPRGRAAIAASAARQPRCPQQRRHLHRLCSQPFAREPAFCWAGLREHQAGCAHGGAALRTKGSKRCPGEASARLRRRREALVILSRSRRKCQRCFETPLCYFC